MTVDHREGVGKLLRASVAAAVLAAAGGATAQSTSYLAETNVIAFSNPSRHPEAPTIGAKATELGSPVEIYEYLYNEFEFLPYYGIRGGSVNTYWRKGGSDVDLAALLIAMLRSQGIPARFAEGTIRLGDGALAAWLGAATRGEAVGILENSGIDVDDTQAGFVKLKHVWVEALIPITNYRGLAGEAADDCSNENETEECKWIALDVSFKQHELRAPTIDGINEALSFDYGRYHGAIQFADEEYKNRNPADILERKILDNHAGGASLQDVIGSKSIVRSSAGVLPGSLPYEVDGTVQRYNAEYSHDNLPTLLSCGSSDLNWTRCLDVTLRARGVDSNGNEYSRFIAQHGIPFFLITTRPTFFYVLPEGTSCGYQECHRIYVWRRNTVIPTFLTGKSADEWYEIKLTANVDPTSTEEPTLTRVLGLNKQHSLVAAGLEANPNQVLDAAKQLLESAESILRGSDGNYYIDFNDNGIVDVPPDYSVAFSMPMWNLLHLAAKEYANQALEKVTRIGGLTHTRTDGAFFLGLTSAESETDVLDEAPFAVAPAGLLVDVHASFSTAPYRYQPALTKYNQVAKLQGYSLSALEHELWQKLTNFDAVSTVRAFQKALGRGIPLVSVSTDADLANLYSQTGFISSADLANVGGFDSTRVNSTFRDFLGERPYFFSSINPGPPDWFTMLKEETDAQTLRLRVWSQKYYDGVVGGYAYNGVPVLLSWPIDLHCLEDALEVLEDYPGETEVEFGDCFEIDFHGTVNQAIALIADQYDFLEQVFFEATGSDLGRYVDYQTDFRLGDYVYRVGPEDLTSAFVPGDELAAIRNFFFATPDAPAPVFDSTTITIPSRLVVEPAGAFFVLTQFTEAGGDYSGIFLIKTEGFSAGGGYVTGSDAIDETITNPGFQNETVRFDNEYNTDQVLNWQSNNGPTCSCTGDPVSTATGNLYHDETDFTIKSHPFDFTFTRTYNSRPGRLIEAVEGISRTYAFSVTNLEEVFWPLGPGWTHSYAMLLISNDFGLFPNDGNPDNSDGKVSSITFVDERGGETSFKVRGATGAYCSTTSTDCVADRPTGFFGDLQNPTSANPAIEFPNGIKYEFVEYLPLRGPNGFAVLRAIDDGFGNELAINFGAAHASPPHAARTQTVTDRAGRTITLQHGGGRLRTASDWTGRTWTFDYDGAANNERLESVTNPVGRTTTYSYVSDAYSPDADERFALARVAFPPRTVDGDTLQRTLSFDFYENGRAFSTSDALGATEFYEYDLFRRETTVTDPRGFTRAHVNDARGALEMLVQQDDNSLRFQNNSDNLRYTKRDAYGRRTEYSYRSNRSIGSAADRDGNVTLERDALGGQVLYDYQITPTSGGQTPYRILTEAGKNGTALDYFYLGSPAGSLKGRLNSVSFRGPATSQTPLRGFYYYPDGVVQHQIDYLQALEFTQTEFVYETDDHIDLTQRRVTDNLSGDTLVWSYEYDDLGRMTRESRELGANPIAHPPGVVRISTEYEYDALDRVIEERRPDGSTLYTDYDEDGNPWRVRALYSNAVTRDLAAREYDAAGHMVAATDALGNRTVFTYDSLGNLLSTTDANGHTVSHEYDAMGRRIKTIDATGNAHTTNYDATGRPQSVVDANGFATRFVRDALGRVTETISPMGFRTIRSYDAQGNVTGVKDANVVAGTQGGNSFGYSVSNQYGLFDRLKKTIDASDGETQFEYDRQGNRTAVVDAEGRRTEFRYNALGQLVSATDPLLQTTTMEYDTIGNLASMTDRRGRITKYFYDAANRLVAVDFLDNGVGADEVRTYDPYGNLQSIGNGAVTYTYEYDDLDRLRRKTDSRGGKSLSWDYDIVGNIIRRTGYEGHVTSYTYDSSNRLVSTSNPDFLGASYHYDRAGRLLDRILSNAARSTFTYDDDGRVVERQEYSFAAELVRSEKYCYDALGNVTKKLMEPNASCESPGNEYHNYTYDNLSRLTSENSIFSPTLPAQILTYDSVNNVSGVLGTEEGLLFHEYDANNRLLRVRSGSNGPIIHQFTYDANGNRTEKRNASGVLLARYVYDSKNRLIELHAGANVTRYEYDPYGYRISQDINGERILYYLEGEHIESIYDDRGKPKATFLRGAIIDEVIAAYHYDARGHKDFYTYFHDGVTSVTALADHLGAITQTYGYSPFGRDRAGTGSTPNTLKYTGREQDPSGLYYYRARYYDPDTRRFLTEDPIGFEGGINLYAYAGNNPLRFNDPMGLVAPDILLDAAFIGADVGAIYSQGLNLGTGTALALDVVGAAVPFATGLGAGFKTFIGLQSEAAQIVNANARAGRIAEDLVEARLIAEGATVLGRQVGAQTSAGLRRIDLLVETADRRIIAVEVKSGGGGRNASQLLKDSLLASEGGVLVGKNAPGFLRGEERFLETIERGVSREAADAAGRLPSLSGGGLSLNLLDGVYSK